MMRRILLLLTVVAVMAAMMVVAAPAFALSVGPTVGGAVPQQYVKHQPLGFSAAIGSAYTPGDLRTAGRSSNLLLFDEADALFGKRSDVHDSHHRYA